MYSGGDDLHTFHYLLFQDGPLRNLHHLGDEDKSAVISEWPDADFLMFQEVWDRFDFLKLAKKLREKGFLYFVADVGKQSLRSNFCAGGKLKTLFHRECFMVI